MPRSDYYRCKSCGKTRDEVGELSRRRLCGPCARQRELDAAVQMQAHTGPFFDRWRRNTALSVGGILLDDVQPLTDTHDDAD